MDYIEGSFTVIDGVVTAGLVAGFIIGAVFLALSQWGPAASAIFVMLCSNWLNERG